MAYDPWPTIFNGAASCRFLSLTVVSGLMKTGSNLMSGICPKSSGTVLPPLRESHGLQWSMAARYPSVKTTSKPAAEPEDRAEDVADALSLLRAARADLDGLEAALLLAARQPGTRTGKPLLTFRQIAAAIGAESEQAAQGRYRRKVGSLNGSDSGHDGTPDLNRQQPAP
jgi:hypothetical protein